MNQETKPQVSKSETFDMLEIRVGRVISVEDAPNTAKKCYKLRIDFGKFGIRTSVGRFTQHTPEELLNLLVVGVLNLGTMEMGDTVSECLILGLQYPKADSGEATPITPLKDVKIGGKLF